MKEVRTVGCKIDVEVEVYAECKYTANAEVFENSKKATFKNVVNWEIVTGDDAKEIEAMTDAESVDDHHEYLVLNFEDGTSSTFRNSYVDMFIIRRHR